MKIYLNNKLVASLKWFHLRQSRNFFCRLTGISLEENGQGTIDVYPVYQTIGIYRHPGQTIISFPWFKKEVLISFSGRGIEVVALPSEQLKLQHSDEVPGANRNGNGKENL